MKKGIVEAPASAGKTALASIVRLAKAVETGKIVLGPSKCKGQESLGDVLKRAATEAGRKDLQVDAGEAPSTQQLVDDARKIAAVGREKQHVLREELGDELGSDLNTAICLQIHEIQLQLATVVHMEEISRELNKGGRI